MDTSIWVHVTNPNGSEPFRYAASMGPGIKSMADGKSVPIRPSDTEPVLEKRSDG
jgi:hypothetical protein